MVARYSLLITILFVIGCEKKLYELSKPKTPYTGNELKIDGYYYSTPYHTNVIGISVFYRNGICMHTLVSVENKDTLSYIENEILLNEPLMSRFWTTPSNIGVFQINEKSIMFETWEAGRDITTFSHFGELLNDSSFVLTKWINNETGKSYYENLIYHFKQFSPKPDSTNVFVK